MDNVQIVKEITQAFCENRLNEQVLSRYFSPDFEHVANGRPSCPWQKPRFSACEHGHRLSR
ncbi:MAG: hypothetical protein ACREMA_10140, partial [Longimicrobiales bacterium]